MLLSLFLRKLFEKKRLIHQKRPWLNLQLWKWPECCVATLFLISYWWCLNQTPFFSNAVENLVCSWLRQQIGEMTHSSLFLYSCDTLTQTTSWGSFCFAAHWPKIPLKSKCFKKLDVLVHLTFNHCYSSEQKFHLFLSLESANTSANGEILRGLNKKGENHWPMVLRHRQKSN